jgi:hypothetical protein
MRFKKTSKTPFHRYAFSKRSNVCIFAAMLTEPQWVMPIGGKIRLDPTMKTMRLVDAVCE